MGGLAGQCECVEGFLHRLHRLLQRSLVPALELQLDLPQGGWVGGQGGGIRDQTCSHVLWGKGEGRERVQPATPHTLYWCSPFLSPKIATFG